MNHTYLPAARVEPALLAELQAALAAGETVESFVLNAVRRAIKQRQLEDFYARGEVAWQDYSRTGVARPAEEVFDRIQARLDAKRKTLLGHPR